jgi:hypothetical protein
MKRVLLFTLTIFLLAIFIPKNRNRDITNLREHEMYLTDHQFHFFAVSDPSDTCFTRRIYSMIDQEYDGYDIYLFVRTENLSDIKTYAKKKNKAHLLHITEIDEDTPIKILMNETIKGLSPSSVVIQLEKDCLFSDTKTLTYINSIFKEAAHPLSLYSNYTTFPSFQQNKEPIDYESSSLKVRYAGDIPSKKHFINAPLYIKQRADRPQGY